MDCTEPANPADTNMAVLELETSRAFYRDRYVRRCANPEYRAKLAAQSLARYHARKARDEAAGVLPKPQGRPRKYHDIMVAHAECLTTCEPEK